MFPNLPFDFILEVSSSVQGNLEKSVDILVNHVPKGNNNTSSTVQERSEISKSSPDVKKMNADKSALNKKIEESKRYVSLKLKYLHCFHILTIQVFSSYDN